MTNPLLAVKRAISLTLVTVFLFSQLACDPPKISHQKLVEVAGYGQMLAGMIVANETLPDALFAQGVIKEARRDQLKGYFKTAKNLTAAFNAKMQEVLALAAPDLRALLPLIADMVDVVEAINPQSAVWQKTLAGIDISLRAIANLFAIVRAQAKLKGYTDRQIEVYAGLTTLRIEHVCAFAAAG